ncbi:MAG: hypothetical protein OXQ32_12015 [bacterium]|nr:hypothetical protein [bacterium]
MLPIHWRFQELLIEHRSVRGDINAIYQLALKVHQTVKEFLPQDHEVVERAQALRHDLARLDFVRGRGRKREIDRRLRVGVRIDCYGILCSAAFAERGDDSTFLRVVDLHPWVAEPAETLSLDNHWGEAVKAASDNVRTQWRSVLQLGSVTPEGKREMNLWDSFSPSPASSGAPRLRFACFDRNRDRQEWSNAHLGARSFAEGCMMRIRNLYKYHRAAQGSNNSGTAIENLAALSRLARWITDAEVVRAESFDTE